MLKKQLGVSTLGILFILVIAVLLFKTLFSIIPAYWDDYVVNKQINGVLQENTPESQWATTINQRLEMNDIQSLEFNQIAQISEVDGKPIISKKYEVRKHWLSNIDLVLTFEKNFDQRTIQVK